MENKIGIFNERKMDTCGQVKTMQNDTCRATVFAFSNENGYYVWMGP